MAKKIIKKIEEGTKEVKGESSKEKKKRSVGEVRKALYGKEE